MSLYCRSQNKSFVLFHHNYCDIFLKHTEMKNTKLGRYKQGHEIYDFKSYTLNR